MEKEEQKSTERSQDSNKLDSQVSINIGQYLKSNRNKKNISLRDISQKTRIGLTLLKELEENNLKNLPDKTYVKGFVKAYTRELGLNPELALKSLELSYEELNQNISKRSSPLYSIQEKSDLKPSTTKTPANSQSSSIFPKSMTILFAFGLILIGAIIYKIFVLTPKLPEQKTTSHQVHEARPTAHAQISDQALPDTKFPSPNEQIDIEKDINGPSTEVATIEEEIPTEVRPQELSNTVETPVIEKIEQNEAPVAEIEKKDLKEEMEQRPKEIVFRSIQSPLFAIEGEEVANENLLEIFPQKYLDKYDDSKENLFLYAQEGNSWLTYKIDDDPVRVITLNQGDTKIMQGNVIQIFMGNFAATQIYYNKKLISGNAPTGVKSLIFPASKNVEFKLPLFVHQGEGKVYTSKEYQLLLQKQN